MVTKTQIRILSTVYYLTKNKNRPVILSHHIQKQLTDLKQGTISSTLNYLEHKLRLIISMPCDPVLRTLYANKKTPGSLRKYYLTPNGKKLVNVYLQIIKKDGINVDYEKLSAATYGIVRVQPDRFEASL